MADPISVFDCDGHIIESIPEMVPFLDPVDRDVALTPSRNRQGVFASVLEPKFVYKIAQQMPRSHQQF